MDSKPTGSEEFEEIFFSAFEAAFNSNLRRPKENVVPNANIRKFEESPHTVPDTYESDDVKVERGDEIDSLCHDAIKTPEFKCPDLNISYVHQLNSSTSRSSKVAFLRQSQRIMKGEDEGHK